MEVLQRTANRGSISTGVYEIGNSLKLESDNTEYLYRTLGTPTSTKKFTISFWVKRTELGRTLSIFGTTQSSSSPEQTFRIFFENDDQFQVQDYDTSNNYRLIVPQVFRDTSAWYHIVVAIDTTQATASNRMKFYVNGGQITDWTDGAETQPAQDHDIDVGSGKVLSIGRWVDDNGTAYTEFNGYLAEYNFIDGQQLASTDFGEYDSDTGIWIPKEYTGTYGNNGFYLDFEDSSSLGADDSGNSNNFTLNNIAAADQATDTPTNNFCTWNPLWVYQYQPIISEGATKVRYDDSTDEGAKATIGLTNGKWYWEAKPVGTIGSQYIGIQTDGDDNIASGQSQSNNYTMVINPTGRYYSYAGSQSESADQGWDLTASDWLGIALDMDSSTQTIKYYKNGSLMQSLDLISDMQDKTVFPFLQNYENRSFDINFGGYTINTISSAATDANGYGTFEYAPPSGYYAICTKNLSEFGG
tara:strand:+ start:2186 stop:3598 length:1413 start_codon:yes stop_codon:yes gene_type:complete